MLSHYHCAILSGILVIGATQSLEAQDALPDPVRLNWDSGSLLVIADSSTGVFIAVTDNERTQVPVSTNAFYFFVEPWLANQWTQMARQILGTTGAGRSDTAEIVTTPQLSGIFSGVLLFQRMWGGAAWMERPHLYVAEELGGSAVVVRMDEAKASSLINAIDAAAQATAKGGVGNEAVIEIDTAVHEFPSAIEGNAHPQYPPSMQREGREGEVWLWYTVNADGSIEVDMEDVLYTDHEDFARAAIQAVREWRYNPGVRDGRPVPSRMFRCIAFRLIVR